jgi:isopentenyl-diphosphate delta-isomerase
VRFELGIVPEALTLVLPDYRYHAVAADGVAENEICPVVRARCSGRIRPDAAEVADAAWCDWDKCQLLAGGVGASPWFRDQMMKLVQLGRPGDWPAADPALLAPAISW